MKIVRVQYTAKPGYAEHNRENISRVMDDLRRLNNPGIKYSSFVFDDEKTFMHLAIFETEEAEKILLELGSFKQFGKELNANGFEIPPKTEHLSLAGSSFEYFA
jgi:hypothetical protein